jgi:hypothetical protein
VRGSSRKNAAVYRLTVVARKSGVTSGFGYGRKKYHGEVAMTDRNATAQRPLDIASGEMAMSRLADRLASMAPPPLNLTAAQVAPMLRPPPAGYTPPAALQHGD